MHINHMNKYNLGKRGEKKKSTNIPRNICKANYPYAFEKRSSAKIMIFSKTQQQRVVFWSRSNRSRKVDQNLLAMLLLVVLIKADRKRQHRQIGSSSFLLASLLPSIMTRQLQHIHRSSSSSSSVVEHHNNNNYNNNNNNHSCNPL